jgi:D-aspartate ligase
MNPYYTGLGIARGLHGHGVPVFALTSEPGTPGARSRYFDGVHTVPNGRDEPERLYRCLLEIAKEYETKPVIFPTRDFDIIFLHEYRDALEPFLLLPQPLDSPILRMMDKLELAGFARQLGIAVPATVSCSSDEDIARQAEALRFPVIIKPRFAYEWRRKGQWEQVGAQKAIIAETIDEAKESYRRVAGVTREVILQEYVPGEDSEIVVCCCHMDKQHELNGHFTARKLRQTPALTGTGSVVEATDVAPIVAPSVQLLKAFGYSGLAEIEYKHDQATDAYVLIEINPRHWDQHELGTLVGVNLSWLAYADLIGLGPVRSAPAYEVGRRYKWIAENELLRGTARQIRAALRTSTGNHQSFVKRAGAAMRICAELKKLLEGQRIFGMWRLRDPLPGVLTWLRIVKDAGSSFLTLLGDKRQANVPNGPSP